MMLLIKDPFFCDPQKELALPVVEISTDNLHGIVLDRNHFYLIDDTIYEYVGEGRMGNVSPGTIVSIGTRYYLEPHEDSIAELYNAKYIISKEIYDNRLKVSGDIESMIQEYIDQYRKGDNLLKSGNIKITPSGDVYIPELLPDDDPLERIIKLMVRHLKLILNDYREKNNKKHWLDNIKSALNGATKNMSILKFLAWCDTLELDWEITIDNLTSKVPNPMHKRIVLNCKSSFDWEDIPVETKDCFTVPLIKGEDPLKRGIKLALWDKKVDLKDYRKKSPTPHLLNNMKSALKSGQKMTVPYFLYWCEIIDLSYTIKITNRQDGIWYKISGYDVTTNDKEEI